MSFYISALKAEAARYAKAASAKKYVAKKDTGYGPSCPKGVSVIPGVGPVWTATGAAYCG